MVKPDWWNDEGLNALSARVVSAAPDDQAAIHMRAVVLSGLSDAWEARPRSATELKEAAMYFDRAAAMCPPAQKTEFATAAGLKRRTADSGAPEAMHILKYDVGVARTPC